MSRADPSNVTATVTGAESIDTGGRLRRGSAVSLFGEPPQDHSLLLKAL
jgi:hypothetical protein